MADFECPSPNCQLPSFGRAGACMACKEWSGICDQFKAELHEIATYLHKVAEERDCAIQRCDELKENCCGECPPEEWQ